MDRPIAISLSPNTQKDDVVLAIKILFSPISWFDFRQTEKLEEVFTKRFGKRYKTIAFNSGRSAFFMIMKALGIGWGDEVIVQAHTCSAAVAPVLWTGARAVFVDIDDSLNLDPKSLTNKINKKTKAIVVQHSFGVPADMNKILKIARRHKVLVIEDCALSLGSKVGNREIGTIGDVSFFSFGRDKVISSVFGGIAMTKDKKLFNKLQEQYYELDHVSPKWLVQQLLHPILFAGILPLYNFGIGKACLLTFQMTGLLSRAVTSDEKRGYRPKIFPKKMPGALAILAINQLKKLDKYNERRIEISEMYIKALGKTGLKILKKKKGVIWLRFPVFHKNAKDLYKYAKGKKVLLGDWYWGLFTSVNNIGKLGYISGSCPKAERVSKEIVNLPTYPTMTDVQVEEVIDTCKKWLSSRRKK